MLDFMKGYSGDAQALASATGVNADFILAWAALESGWGVGLNNGTTGRIAQANNNFFGLLVPSVEGNPTGGWKGAVPCDATQGQVMGAACFDLWGNGVGGSLSLVPSGMGGTERTERFLFRPTPGGASQLLRRYLYDG